jgi:alkylation response protein AidB-like acyl-CoA dehydrogenase
MLSFLMDERQKQLQEETRAFVRGVDKQLILDMDAERINYPAGYMHELAAANLIGLRFPQELGGRGYGWSEEVVALEEIGYLGTSLACLYSLPSIVGEAIHIFGTKQQKETYLKATLQGKKFTAEALTEPRGGSDFFGATTTAKKVDGGYLLNGQKRFIVGAEGADYFLVYAKTADNTSPHKNVSAFLVDRGPGVEVKHVYGLMGTRGGGAGRLVFKDAFVPAENLVGEENGAGTIFYRMMIPERLTSAAGALGMGQAALDVALKYSRKRKAFGQPIKNFQAVSFKVADSITQLDAARALIYATARCVDSDSPAALQRRMVSQAKKLCTETAWNVVNHAMQILGGIGYTNVYPVERFLRDIRLIMIWTGTNEIMDLIIQHEYYKETENGPAGRDVEQDAPEAENEEEKIYE